MSDEAVRREVKKKLLVTDVLKNPGFSFYEHFNKGGLNKNLIELLCSNR